MKYFLVLLILLFLLAAIPPTVIASSQQAYQDYQYQFDKYRQQLVSYTNALTQYKQFNSLTSQQYALDQAKTLITQRNAAARSYFLFLNEKLNENPGILQSEAAGYRTTITNTVAFLDQNSLSASTVQSLADTQTVSNDFVKQYNSMQLSWRQTILAIELGYLEFFAEQFDSSAAQAQLLIQLSQGQFTPEKQATLDRWLVSLANQHSLYQEKFTSIRTAASKLTGDVVQQERDFSAIQKTLNGAKQSLGEGISYLKELQDELQYE